VYQATRCVEASPGLLSEECVESYTLFDLNLGYQLPRIPQASLQLFVQNLFDTGYRSFPGVPNIGRMAVLRLRFEL
jgi:outer membrane receptor protein involved in Fe transport